MKNFIMLCSRAIFIVTTIFFISCSDNDPITSDSESLISSKRYLKNLDGTIVTKIPVDAIEIIQKDIEEKFGTDGVEEFLDTYNLETGELLVYENGIKNSNRITVNDVQVYYQVHVAGIGWMSPVPLGLIAGTTGQDRRMEGIIFSMSAYSPSDIRARAHSSGIGWLPYKNMDELVGTTGQYSRMEAIQLQVDPEFADVVLYRSHVQNLGWLPWVTNGEISGTTGRYLRMEAFQLKLYKY